MSQNVTAKSKLDLLKIIGAVDTYSTAEGNAEGTVFYSGVKITILETHKSYAKIQVSFELNGKPFWVIAPVDLNNGCSQTIYCEGDFKIQNRIIIS